MNSRRCWAMVVLVASMALITPFAAVVPSASAADGPGVGDPWIVSVGDGFFAGEGTRWAGNGPDLFGVNPHRGWWQNDTGTPYQQCHRTVIAPIAINLPASSGRGFSGMPMSRNFACSGATDESGTVNGTFIPGVDFSTATGNPATYGQARQLQDFARTHNVRMIVLSLGNSGMAKLYRRCAEDFPRDRGCPDVGLKDANLIEALTNIRQAMSTAGYRNDQYVVVVATTPQLVAGSGANRYGSRTNNGFDENDRVSTCPFWNENIDHLNGFAAYQSGLFEHLVEKYNWGAYGPGPRAVLLRLDNVFDGHLLCQKGVGGYADDERWQTGGPDKVEWVTKYDASTFSYLPDAVERLHPNAWGAWAIRNCVRKVYAQLTANKSWVGGWCTPQTQVFLNGEWVTAGSAGVNYAGEPNLFFVPTADANPPWRQVQPPTTTTTTTTPTTTSTTTTTTTTPPTTTTKPPATTIVYDPRCPSCIL